MSPCAIRTRLNNRNSNVNAFLIINLVKVFEIKSKIEAYQITCTQNFISAKNVFIRVRYQHISVAVRAFIGERFKKRYLFIALLCDNIAIKTLLSIGQKLSS